MGLYDFNQHDDEDDFPWWVKVLLTVMATALLAAILALVKEMAANG